MCCRAFRCSSRDLGRAAIKRPSSSSYNALILVLLFSMCIRQAYLNFARGFAIQAPLDKKRSFRHYRGGFPAFWHTSPLIINRNPGRMLSLDQNQAARSPAAHGEGGSSASVNRGGCAVRTGLPARKPPPTRSPRWWSVCSLRSRLEWALSLLEIGRSRPTRFPVNSGHLPREPAGVDCFKKPGQSI